jgi:hypothetical protein
LLTYSYTVPGHDLEVGEHRKRFEDEEEADKWARALRDTYVDVRVDTADATRSVWQETPVLTSSSLRAPELDASRLQGIKAWGTRELLAAIVFCVAITGAFFAAWIQLSCFTGKPLITAEQDTRAFFGMHIGAMLCGVGGALVAYRGKWSRSAWQRSFKTRTASIGMKVLGAYTTIVLLYGWVRTAAGDGGSRYFDALMFSAVWLLFYVGSAAASLQAMQHWGNDS